MGTRETAAQRGRRRAAESLDAVLRDLRTTRVARGLSQEELGALVGVSRYRVRRLEARAGRSSDIGDVGAIAGVLGLDLVTTTYPAGDPVRDRVQLRMLPAFQGRCHASVRWRTEVVLPIRDDRRAWDAVAVCEDGGWTGIELISRLGEVDATLRRANAKQRDDPRITRVVLVVADTVRNREALATARAAVRAEFPLDTRGVLASLAAGRTPTENGVVLIRVPRPDPQDVHNGGKVVDGSAAEPPNFVDNRLGGTLGARYRTCCPRGPTEAHSGGDHLKNAVALPAEITSRLGRRPTCDHIKGRGALQVPSGASFTAVAGPQGSCATGARQDATGIPVSVLLPGVEV